MKLLKIIIAIIFILSLASCKSYSYENKGHANSLIIDKIKLNKEYEINSIKKEVIGLTMFLEYGRPDEDNTNTIIGAHSGYGVNAYFNRVSELIAGDEINLIYNGINYKYKVQNVLEVNDTDLSILDNKDESVLTLLTCKIGDNSKRVVVISTKLDK